MSTNRLDKVETFDQFGYDHWKTLGTKLGGPEVVKSVLRGNSIVIVETVRYLSDFTLFDIPGSTKKIKDLFKNHEGLHISDEVKNRKVTDDVEVITSDIVLAYANTVKSANDAEITAKLPEGYVFEDTIIFDSYLDTLLNLHRDEKESNFLSNHDVNIFYVGRVNMEFVTISIIWNSDCKRWNRKEHRRDDIRWHTGCRVFSATVDS